MGEVEAQPVGGHQGPLLFHVRAEDFAQRPVEQMGAGVVAPDGGPALAVDGDVGLLARPRLALADHGEVAVQPRQRGRGRDGPARWTVEMMPVSPTCPPASA